MTYAKLISAEPETGKILRLDLEDTHDQSNSSIRIWGTKKQLRKAASGGKIEGSIVVYNKSLRMLEGDWLKIQPILSKMDYGPMLNQHMQLSYDELQNIPRWAWKAGFRDRGYGSERLFTYHSVNLFQKRVDPEASDFGNLYGIIREQNFPEDGQMKIAGRSLW